MPDPHYYTGSDDRELGGPPPRTPEQSFRHAWRYIRCQGPEVIEDFLSYHGQLALFAHLVQDCREELADARARLIALELAGD